MNLEHLLDTYGYVALFWLGIWFVSGIVASILMGIESDQRRSRFFLEQRAARKAADPMRHEDARQNQHPSTEHESPAGVTCG